jgi:predicted Zn-dependent peptidase
LLNKNHIVQQKLVTVPQAHVFMEYPTTANQVFMVNYDMQQAEIQLFSKGRLYDKTLEPQLRLYNEYFGGSMASPVFQTLRESKALAYSVASRVIMPLFKERSYFNFAYIGTQADKVPEALPGLMDLLTNFPVSDPGFATAKASLMQEIQTGRITKTDILFTYDANRRLGIDYDIRKDVYDKLPKLTLKDLQSFHEQNVSNSKYNIMVLGKREKINQEELGKAGPITELELQEIFGY